MKVLLALTLVCVVVVGSAMGDNWALLVAGSNTYFNYRHQADVCHAYHIVRSHGIPDERIVVMMYDDIANNYENPIKGNIINEPNGPNLYPGVLKDYTGDYVMPEVFLKVLSGDEKGVEQIIDRKGKVIKSGPNDNVFVYFADHGAPGIIGFPNFKVLHAKQLNDVIVKMHKNNQYKEMVLYVEACESGSMFQDILKNDLNVIAVTAANADESSYACYLDGLRKTYLGDLFSVNWMQDSDAENLGKETIHEQVEIVTKETNKSHVMVYGDLSMEKKKVGDFQGNLSETFLRFRRGKGYSPIADAVPSEDVPLEILTRKMEDANGMEKVQHKLAILNLLKKKEETRNFFKSIVQSVINSNYDDILERKVRFTDFTCYTESVDMILSLCPAMQLSQNDYAMRNLRALANLCETNVPKEMIWTAVKNIIAKSLIC